MHLSSDGAVPSPFDAASSCLRWDGFSRFFSLFVVVDVVAGGSDRASQISKDEGGSSRVVTRVLFLPV